MVTRIGIAPRPLGAALFLSLLVPSSAFAQEAPSQVDAGVAATTPTPALTPQDVEARAAFDLGNAALADERYADALEQFERSFRIRRAAGVALNLGITLRALGRLVEARVRFNEFLELASPTLHERHDRDVTGFIAEIGRRVGRIGVTTTPATVVLRIDGRRTVLDERGDAIVDPGEHTVEASLPSYESASERVRVASGARADVRLTLRLVPDPRVTLRTPTPTQQPNPVLTSPWLWIGVGAAVTAAITIPIAVTQSGTSAIPQMPDVNFCARTNGTMCMTGMR